MGPMSVFPEFDKLADWLDQFTKHEAESKRLTTEFQQLRDTFLTRSEEDARTYVACTSCGWRLSEESMRNAPGEPRGPYVFRKEAESARAREAQLRKDLDDAWDAYQLGPTVDRESAVWRALGAFLGKPAAN